jgi:hypothetical protein
MAWNSNESWRVRSIASAGAESPSQHMSVVGPKTDMSVVAQASHISSCCAAVRSASESCRFLFGKRRRHSVQTCRVSRVSRVSRWRSISDSVFRLIERAASAAPGAS